jgi:hypothetical protein
MGLLYVPRPPSHLFTRLHLFLIEGLGSLPLREHCDVPWLVLPPSNSRGGQALGERDLFPILIG